MVLEVLEIGIAASSAVILSFCRMRIHRQRAVAWDRLVAQLKPGCLAPALDHESLKNGDCDTSLGVSWGRIQGARGFWEMYENAGVMLQMADYAIRNGAAVDAELLENLRSDATQIRVRIFCALSEHASGHVTEEARATIASVTALYCDMVSRTAAMMQANDGVLNHGFACSL